MIKGVLGVTDIPQDSADTDTLGVKKYIEGLEKFIMNCPTPMSIALQGDWGTGKTSFLQAMKTDFENESNKQNIVSIYFNTWQYSQFNMSDNLYVSFMNNIVNRLGEQSGNNEKAKDFSKKIGRLFYGVAKQVVKKTTDVDISEVESEFVNHEQEKAQTIASMKKDFTMMVEETVKNDNDKDKRVVIFIDDLDRLNPEIAVELLEVMKLFMDVPNCIFVLAIDYEVVVSGVRKKFGNDMSEEKCRSFFDKIIQLPFRMPVESYRIENMIKSVLGNRMEKYMSPICILIKETLGTNPRTLKRLANSFFLLETVRNCQNPEQTETEYQSALLLISLVIQMDSYDAYQTLIECEDVDALKSVFEDININSIDNESDNKEYETLQEVKETLKKIQEIDKEQEKITYNKFFTALHLSSITSITKTKELSNHERQAAKKINIVELNQTKIAVKNPTEALIRTFEYELEKNTDKIEACVKELGRILTFDENAQKGMFRQKVQLPFETEGEGLYLGTSNSYNSKIDMTKRLCKCLGEKPGTIKWYDENVEMFRN